LTAVAKTPAKRQHQSHFGFIEFGVMGVLGDFDLKLFSIVQNDAALGNGLNVHIDWQKECSIFL
jgi:hypothetical protein